MNKKGEIFNQVEHVFEQLSKVVKDLERFGRKDKKNIQGILDKEFIALYDYFNSNPLPYMYQKKEIENLLAKIRIEIEELETLRNNYQKLQTYQETLANSFDIVTKNTLAYQELEDLLETMKMYLNYDRNYEFERVRNHFQRQFQKLENLPQEKAEYLQKHINKLKSKAASITSDRKRDKIINLLNEYLTRDPEEQIRLRDEISKLENRIDQILSNEYKKELRANLLSRVYTRLLGKEMEEKPSTDNYHVELKNIQGLFRKGVFGGRS